MTESESVELEPSEKNPRSRDRAAGPAVHAARESVLGAVLASARHELRSPLQSIQGFAELLDCQLYGGLTDEQQTFVKHILQGSLELAKVIDTCLELSEVELASAPLELARHELPGLIAQILARHGERTGASIALRVGPQAESARAKVEPATLGRAIEALLTALSTGARSLDEGESRLTAQLELEGEQVCLRVLRGALASGVLYSLDELAVQRHKGRNLIWLRLAAKLLTMQDATLLISEDLTRAEVRLRLSCTH